MMKLIQNLKFLISFVINIILRRLHWRNIIALDFINAEGACVYKTARIGV